MTRFIIGESVEVKRELDFPSPSIVGHRGVIKTHEGKSIKFGFTYFMECTTCIGIHFVFHAELDKHTQVFAFEEV